MDKETQGTPQEREAVTKLEAFLKENNIVLLASPIEIVQDMDTGTLRALPQRILLRVIDPVEGKVVES